MRGGEARGVGRLEIPDRRSARHKKVTNVGRDLRFLVPDLPTTELVSLLDEESACGHSLCSMSTGRENGLTFWNRDIVIESTVCLALSPACGECADVEILLVGRHRKQKNRGEGNFTCCLS